MVCSRTYVSLRGLERPEDRENMDEDLGEFLFYALWCGRTDFSEAAQVISHQPCEKHKRGTSRETNSLCPAFVFLTSWLFGCSLCWDAVTGLLGFICMRVTLQVWSWF